MDMTSVKTVAVVAIVMGCFGVLYPKIFHPMIMHLVGSGKAKDTINDQHFDKLPPPLRARGAGTPIKDPMEDMTRHMRPGPHPGMRAAAEMKKQMSQTATGAGKGMMGIVLPMYAVGIVIYLIYTLTKVFGKNKDSSEDFKSPFKAGEERYSTDQQKRQMQQKDNNPIHEAARLGLGNLQNPKHLEQLLTKVEGESISEVEMRELRSRLMETEAQMSRILQAMDTVGKKVTEAASNQDDEDLDDEDIEEVQAEEDPGLKKNKPVQKKKAEPQCPAPAKQAVRKCKTKKQGTNVTTEVLEPMSAENEMSPDADINEAPEAEYENPAGFEAMEGDNHDLPNEEEIYEDDFEEDDENEEDEEEIEEDIDCSEEEELPGGKVEMIGSQNHDEKSNNVSNPSLRKRLAQDSANDKA